MPPKLVFDLSRLGLRPSTWSLLFRQKRKGRVQFLRMKEFFVSREYAYNITCDVLYI